MHIPSFAKINWALEILGRRPDGYHELRTILQTIDVRDKLAFSRTSHGIQLHCDHPEIPCDESNLIYRAAKKLQTFTGCDKGVTITLEKLIPLGAGLGGGSSNAAATLLGLINLWQVEISPADLFQLGAQLGADVPFFFLGGTGIGIGRGDEVYPMEDITAEHLLLINPKINVPTPEIYRNLPSELTSAPVLNKMPFSLAAAYVYMQTAELKLRNDLERSAFILYPLLNEIKQRLLELGASAALMSGSGATVFAVFESAAVCAQAQAEFLANGWWCAATRTLTRHAYQTAITQDFSF